MNVQQEPFSMPTYTQALQPVQPAHDHSLPETDKEQRPADTAEAGQLKTPISHDGDPGVYIIDSDGDITHVPTNSKAVQASAANMDSYCDRLYRLLKERGGNSKVYQTVRFPAEYRAYKFVYASNTRIWICGHPEHRPFNTTGKLLDHALWLAEGPQGIWKCVCCRPSAKTYN